MEGPQCKYYEICGLTADSVIEPRLCILHSNEPSKDRKSFDSALEKHRQEKGNVFRHFVFPEKADFGEVIFSEEADFTDATFNDDAIFSRASFLKRVSFIEANFLKRAIFYGCKFSEEVDFRRCDFSEQVDFFGSRFDGWTNFGGVRFLGKALFFRCTFSGSSIWSWANFSDMAIFDQVSFLESVDFQGAKFSETANFISSTFNDYANFSRSIFSKPSNFSLSTFVGKVWFYGATFESGASFNESSFSSKVSFRRCSFHGRTFFSDRENKNGNQKVKTNAVFAGVEVDFSEVEIDPPQSLTFRNADLSKCRFLGTNMRKVEMSGFTSLLIIGKRPYLYDETSLIEKDENHYFLKLEALYRDLKTMYEEAGDHERAGDFHYGEMQMRRKSPNTGVTLRFFLAIYWLISGYGERYLRPLISALIVLVIFTLGYLLLGITPPNTTKALDPSSILDWLRTLHFSLQVMILLKPTNWVLTEMATIIRTIQSIIGPLILALFALALRQRLKR